MSGITGEIGYKVHAAGAATPRVNTLNVIGTLSMMGTMTVDGFVVIAPTGTTGTDTAALRVVANRRAPAILCTSFGNAAIGAAYALQVQGTGVTGFSYGLEIFAGSNSSDQAIDVGPASQSSLRFFQIFGDGSGKAGPQTASNKGISWGTGGAVKIDATNSVSNGVALTVNAATGTDIFNANINNIRSFAITAQDGAVVLGTGTAYAWGTGTHYPVIQLAGVGALYGTGTAGVVLLGGGLYYNGTSYIYGQAGTGIIVSAVNGSLSVQCVATAGTANGTAATTAVFVIAGTVTSNSIQGYGPNAAALTDMTPDTITFGVTLTGVTPSVTGTMTAKKMGNLVTVYCNSLLGTSNAATCTITGVPNALVPTQRQLIPINMQNNGANILAYVDLASTTFTLAVNSVSGTFNGYNSAGFTASGQKGLSLSSFTYALT